MSFDTELAEAQSAIGDGFDRLFAATPDLPLHRAMRHAVSGGKRLRGFLVVAGARLHGAEDALNPALAIEAIHAYSLVHDDLPAMDDDDVRRGQPTLHRAFDEATAILAGDALQTLGFELCLAPGCHPDAAVRADLAFSLARASGADGMVLGQALDIAAESAADPLDLDGITRLQAGKTGALIGWAAEAGPRLAGADIAPMRAYAQALGLAFQITDDLLDHEGDAGEMGKAVGKDAGAGKATFVSLLGADGARARASQLVDEACDALAPYGKEAASLIAAARFAISRRS
ncbi:Farnesyl diphosphate synthase [Roseivivax jejudonensis]|uniref:Geranylgeranyl diphosphate synthase n=1 Tax=Roseivivax jejudonensis TaxID=1529041 RepID=A0A1X6ZQC5_9RHOB|nr:polyprenyl synthetase family protein [Roseivivax jejudonensis]SLN58330.1 Farnesyl diphosphate synthase [Roseivivax jejudonensis]